MEQLKSIIYKINQNWYSITIISILVLGVLMLFYKDLSVNIKETLIPALVIYIIGTGLIGYFQGAYYRAKGMKNRFEEPLWIYYILHSIWFISLIIYLAIYKNVL
jgi:hypothetical protein